MAIIINTIEEFQQYLDDTEMNIPNDVAEQYDNLMETEAPANKLEYLACEEVLEGSILGNAYSTTKFNLDREIMIAYLQERSQ